MMAGFCCGSINELHDQLAFGSAADARDNFIDSSDMFRNQLGKMVEKPGTMNTFLA
jgi:hypothetical protein